jgi:DNA (cytosine-5)-methyltransferase 1
LKSRGLKAVDLFAGAGGLSLAAVLAGFEMEFAVENDRHAAITYQKNICDRLSATPTHLYSEDIAALDPAGLSAKHFSNLDRCDLLLGGPPCQGFSTHRICNAGVNDPRNELVHTYFEFVKALKPKVFLMENVPGILWKRHRSYLRKFYREGKLAGYRLFDPVVIDARDFGVPQRRRRVFILGLEEGIDSAEFEWPIKSTHGNANAIAKNSDLHPWVACAGVFKDADINDINNIHMNHGADLTEVFKNTPINGGSRKESGRILRCHETHDGHKDVYGRIDPSQPAPTMTTACTNPSKGRFVHPTKNHGISVREAARIQTFPDDFVFYGGSIASSKQIGNAVPVGLGKIIIDNIAKLIAENTEPVRVPAGKQARKVA